LTFEKNQKGIDHGATANRIPAKFEEEFLNEIGESKPTCPSDWRTGQSHLRHRQWTHDITADNDLRLCRFLGLTDSYFLRLLTRPLPSVSRDQADRFQSNLDVSLGG
jgi:hypothetical protein